MLTLRTSILFVLFTVSSTHVALGQDPASEWKRAPSPLVTRWAGQVSPSNALPEYPRPQMVRNDWLNLNGLWDYALSDPDVLAAPTSFTGKILVPFPYESALSGIGGRSPTKQTLWYHRTISVPANWTGQRILLHFGAVNWKTTVLINGKQVGVHLGGYTGFEFDITDFLQSGSNDLEVSVINPLSTENPTSQVLGKQREHSHDIFYTGSTGIWQTVWLEDVPASHIISLKMTPDIDNKVLHLVVHSSQPGQIVVQVSEGSSPTAEAKGDSDARIDVSIPMPHLWSPEDPHLYDLNVTMMSNGQKIDAVTSYFGMRKISLGKDDKGRTRIFLNNQFYLEIGILDQGYWPDGLYTAPTDEALKFDIQAAKGYGYNLLRKHAKVEPARWYYWADKIGMLVWQDMPQAFTGPDKEPKIPDEQKAEFKQELQDEINQFIDVPSIVVWTTFNEGWGQHDTESIVEFVRQLDPSRLINNASGWTDKGVGDIRDTHAYPGPWSEKPEANRATVNGEFGGISESVDDHRWNGDKFGYGNILHGTWLPTKRYQALLQNAYKLSDMQGTSAFVYTELTDVEQELNGILTYDRLVTKFNMDILTAANKNQFPALPPDPSPQFVPTAQNDPVQWRYTTDRPANDDWKNASFDDSTWKTGPAPFGQGKGEPRTNWKTDDIWMRRSFTLPQDIPAKLMFYMFHDEDTEIYLNGVFAAKAGGFNGDYDQFTMEDAGRAALKPGQNMIALHVHQTVGGQIIDIGIIAVP